jgi:HlyD family secretion protein
MASSSRALLRAHIAGALLLLAACGQRTEDVALGYVEADYVRLSSPLAGQLAKLYLQRGQQVAAGAAAFTLEQESERAGQAESRHRVEQARRQLADLQAGRRPDEIRALQAQLDQARAALVASTADLERTQRLVRDRFVSPSRLDEQRAVVQRDRARVDELAANLRQGRQGARENQVAAAQQDLEAAEAQAEQAGWRVEQKTRTVPVAGVVFDVLFREGEWVPAGSPVVTLLPPGNIKARFFVSQSVAGGLRLGQPVQLSCDGCGAPVSARISFLSPETEYTAPVIYSRDQRDKLVVMVEARPDDPKRPPLRVGQPLEVRFGAPPAP